MNPTVFPTSPANHHGVATPGMELRDHFALEILKVLLVEVQQTPTFKNQKTCVNMAYDLADVMLEARKS